MNKEQLELLDKVYENYRNAFIEGHIHEELDKCLSQEEFIEEIKTDDEFSEKWGLKIEERELSLEEQAYAYNNLLEKQNYNPKWQSKIKDIDKLNEGELMTILQSLPGPSKLITLSYHDKTIESYE